MKKILISLLVAILALSLCGAALAEELQIGSTGISVTLPSGYQDEELTSEDTSYGMVWYRYGSSLDVAAYVNETDETLADVLADYQSDSTVTDGGYCSGTLGGLTFAYVAYTQTDDSETYQIVDYFTVVNGQCVEIVFFMDLNDTTAANYARNIMSTVTYSGSASQSAPAAAAPAASSGTVSLGSTRLSMTLPSGYTADELTSEDLSYGMTNYWGTDYLGIAVYVDDGTGTTVDDVLAELQSDSSYSQTGTTVINGISFAYGVYSDTSDGETYTVIEYITVVDGQRVEVCFDMYAEDTASSSSEAASIMNTIQLH